MKFGERAEHEPEKSRLNFGSETEHNYPGYGEQRTAIFHSVTQLLKSAYMTPTHRRSIVCCTSLLRNRSHWTPLNLER